MKKLLIVIVLGIVLLPKFVTNPYRVERPNWNYQTVRIVR